MSSRSAQIDLSAYRSGNAKVFVGRSRGEACRREAGLEDLDRLETPVVVHVPVDVYSVNSSFFLGMFGPSVRALGEKKFRKLYTFTGKNIASTVEDGIREALDHRSPLPLS